MALREFTDSRGSRWSVWDVFPTLAERRHREAGPPPGVRERRRFFDRRVRVRSAMSGGWLAFESEDGERRRLAPIPDTPRGWESATEHELRSWLAIAEPAPPARRLIE
jgi:hypothetical protein